MRYKLTIEYDGSVRGLARANNGRSFQGVLEDAVQSSVRRIGTCARSGTHDAGVHARDRWRMWISRGALPSFHLARALNALAAGDVALHAVEEVEQDFHARFSASSRMYRYTIAPSSLRVVRGTRWMLLRQRGSRCHCPGGAVY
jgi:tRNA pseudouridine38-40 synthase